MCRGAPPRRFCRPLQGHGTSTASGTPFSFTVRRARVRVRRQALDGSAWRAAAPQATGTLTRGVASTVTLAGPFSFKGFLVKSPALSAGTLSALSSGAAFQPCGFGHTDAQLKSAVTFTLLPSASASSVTLTGFVVVTQSQWYSFSTTLPVAAAQAPPLAGNVTAVPPPPVASSTCGVSDRVLSVVAAFAGAVAAVA